MLPAYNVWDKELSRHSGYALLLQLSIHRIRWKITIFFDDLLVRQARLGLAAVDWLATAADTIQPHIVTNTTAVLQFEACDGIKCFIITLGAQHCSNLRRSIVRLDIAWQMYGYSIRFWWCGSLLLLLGGLRVHGDACYLSRTASAVVVVFFAVIVHRTKMPSNTEKYGNADRVMATMISHSPSQPPKRIMQCLWNCIIWPKANLACFYQWMGSSLLPPEKMNHFLIRVFVFRYNPLSISLSPIHPWCCSYIHINALTCAIRHYCEYIFTRFLSFLLFCFFVLIAGGLLSTGKRCWRLLVWGAQSAWLGAKPKCNVASCR